MTLETGVMSAVVFLSAHDWVDIYRLAKIGGIGSVIGGVVVGGWVYFSTKGDTDRFDKTTLGVLIGVILGGLSGVGGGFVLP